MEKGVIRFRVMLAFALFGLSCLSIIGAGSARADASLITSFGKGSVQVRLYTDYFCGPCSRMEPAIEDILANLIKRNIITLTFVDTPVHKGTPLYAKYFLYVLNAERSFKPVLRSRAVLFSAAKDKIEEKDLLEGYLKKNKVKFREMDPRPVFGALSALMQEDDVKSTPTCVIINEGKKSILSGQVEITKALQSLAQ
jgi:hypothetical protein